MAEHLIAAPPVKPTEFRETFANDLEERAEALREDVRFLSEAVVIGPAKIVEVAELSAEYSADAELLELQDQFDPLWLAEQEDAGVPREDLIERAQQALVRHRERMEKLEREHVQRVRLEDIDRAVRTASRLRGMPETNTTRILSAYHEVDSRLSELERYLRGAVYEVDREIELQNDIKRGK